MDPWQNVRTAVPLSNMDHSISIFRIFIHLEQSRSQPPAICQSGSVRLLVTLLEMEGFRYAESS